MRAPAFIQAVSEGRWIDTYLEYHPGVTTMWLSGIGMKLYAWTEGLPLEQLLNRKHLPFGVLNEATTAGVVPLALVISLSLVLIYFILKNLADYYVAVTAVSLIALDPLYLTHSKVLHVDAILTTFMILSALYLLLHTQTTQLRHLILSGIFAGLAFLTKSPSLFLLPYTALHLAIALIVRIKHTSFWPEMRSTALHLLLWGGAAALTFVLLWPRMWVAPLETVQLIWENAFLRTQQVHPNQFFFNGAITTEDPGYWFYVAVVALRSTSITLVMAIASLPLAIVNLKKDKRQYHYLLGWMAVYALFFFIQMGLSAKKGDRYLLPFFPAWDIMAAIGLVHAAQLLKQVKWQWIQHLSIGTAITAVLLFQAISVYKVHPYYGTYYNPLLGGAKQAVNFLTMQGQGEGLDLAGQFLSSLPDSEHILLSMPAGADQVNMVARNFTGQVNANTNIIPDPEADYRLYYLNWVMRESGSVEWREALAHDMQREPFWTADFNGVTFVWIFDNESD